MFKYHHTIHHIFSRKLFIFVSKNIFFKQLIINKYLLKGQSVLFLKHYSTCHACKTFSVFQKCTKTLEKK